MTLEAKQKRNRYLEEIHRLSVALKIMTKLNEFWQDVAIFKNESLNELKAKYEGDQWNNSILSQ